jgi:RNA polymerase sigma-70 factor (sigma-E family)
VNADDARDFHDYVTGRGPALYRFAYLLVGDPHDAQDLVQDVLGAAAPRWGKIRRSDSVDAYVRRALCNASVSLWRRPSRRRERPTRVLPEVTAQAPIDLELRDSVMALLRRLPRGQREVLVLRYYEQLSEAETAAALGIAVGTVKSQASKATAALRALLAEEPLMGREGE